MGRICNNIKVFFAYWMNFFIWNKEGWYVGDVPPSDTQGFRIMTKQKPYTERTCKVCKETFWSHKKSNVCFRLKCYMSYYRRGCATNTCKN